MRVYAIWKGNKILLGIYGAFLLVSSLRDKHLGSHISILTIYKPQGAIAGAYYIIEKDAVSATASECLWYMPDERCSCNDLRFCSKYFRGWVFLWKCDGCGLDLSFPPPC